MDAKKTPQRIGRILDISKKHPEFLNKLMAIYERGGADSEWINHKTKELYRESLKLRKASTH